MKRIILTLVTLLLTVNSFAKSSRPTDNWSVASWPTTFTNAIDFSNEKASNVNEWICIGEVTLTKMVWYESKTIPQFSYWKSTGQTIKATLYVMELADQLIYRISYGGSYYAVMKEEAKPKYVIIDEQRYEFLEGPEKK